MKQLHLRPVGCTEAVRVFGIRAARVLLITMSWALFLIALVAGVLAEMAGRSASRIRIR
jgi:hypothetical protein